MWRGLYLSPLVVEIPTTRGNGQLPRPYKTKQNGIEA